MWNIEKCVAFELGPWSRRLRALSVHVVMALLLAACTPPVSQYKIEEQALSCEEANRLTYDTIAAMGFTVTRFDPAAMAKAGVLKATRDRGRLGVQNVTVAIDCKPGAVSIDPREDGKLLDQTDIKRGFYITFLTVRSSKTKSEELDRHLIAGTAPESIQRKDVRVLIEPVRGAASKLDFGIEMGPAGVLPVRVRITNMTDRRYHLDPSEIRLTRSDRQRVEALTPEDAAARITAGHAEGGEPLTALSSGDLAARLREKLFVTKELRPHTDASGFLYFPLAEYKRARVVLVEDESEESEGFMVEF